MSDNVLLGPLGAGFLVCYLLGLLVIGWIGKRLSRERSLSDFFLAGRRLGLLTLFLTLYATQYSGNTLVGMAANAYRQGFSFVVSVTFMVGIIAVYWLYAPRLQWLSARKAYITPGDFVRDRYGSARLALVLNLIFLVTLASFILANLKAMGHVVEVVSDGAVPFAWAILLLSVVMVLVSFGAAVYPQAIQRIYAAPDGRTLKHALQLMLVMPLVTTLFVLVIGILGTVRFPGLDHAGSEQITLLMLRDLAQNAPGLKWLLILFVGAVIAAITSTIDSALLSLSSILTQDFVRPRMPRSTEVRLTYVGKLLSWIVMAIAVWLAISLPQTIWKLTLVKLELLVQSAPSMLLGVSDAKRYTGAMLAGVVTGVVVTLSLMLAGSAIPGFSADPLGIDAGVWGLGANVLVSLCWSRLRSARRPSSALG